jgi:hypothetical protein
LVLLKREPKPLACLRAYLPAATDLAAFEPDNAKSPIW